MNDLLSDARYYDKLLLKLKLHVQSLKLIFYVVPFSITFYGLYFSHHTLYTFKLQIFNGPLCAASMYCFVHLFLDIWVLIFVVFFDL